MTLSVSIPFVSFPVPPFREGRQDALRQLVIFIRECPAVVFRHVVVVEPEVYGLAYLECSLVHCHYQCLHRLIALSTTRAILPMAPIITHLFIISSQSLYCAISFSAAMSAFSFVLLWFIAFTLVLGGRVFTFARFSITPKWAPFKEASVTASSVFAF